MIIIFSYKNFVNVHDFYHHNIPPNIHPAWLWISNGRPVLTYLRRALCGPSRGRLCCGPVTPFNWCIIYKTISSSFLNKKWSVLRKDCCTKKLFFQDFFFKQYIPIAFLSIAELLLQFLIKNMVLIRLRAPNQKFLWIFPHKNLMAW